MQWWQYRLAAAAAFAAAAALALRSPAPLRFASGGRFKVALFADLHYGENAWTDWGPAQDAASDRVMATVLDDEKPGCSFRGTPRIELMTAELNRDGADGLSRSSLGPQELWPGVSNYVLQVLSYEERQDPALLMYFLDSGGGSYPEVISSAQLTWFRSQSHFLNPDGRIPELIFWHIPSTAYVKVAPKANTEISKPCIGSLNEEDVAPQEAEWGMMDALAKRSSVKAIFVGHNHGLDWCCPYEKLWLCFARHTGHGGYGDWPRGARIVEITQKSFSVHSWIRMENGTSHSHIILS